MMRDKAIRYKLLKMIMEYEPYADPRRFYLLTSRLRVAQRGAHYCLTWGDAEHTGEYVLQKNADHTSIKRFIEMALRLDPSLMRKPKRKRTIPCYVVIQSIELVMYSMTVLLATFFMPYVHKYQVHSIHMLIGGAGVAVVLLFLRSLYGIHRNIISLTLPFISLVFLLIQNLPAGIAGFLCQGIVIVGGMIVSKVYRRRWYHKTLR